MKKQRPNLHCVLFNAVTGEGLENIKKALKPGPVCITHEGLFRYLSHDLQAKTAKIIHEILKEHGGVYITPDIHTQQEIDDFNKISPMKAVNKKHSKMTGTNIEKNHFKDKSNNGGTFIRTSLRNG